jgi:peroxiredoxin Q/BCP
MPVPDSPGPLAPGDRAPDFELAAGGGGRVRLATLLKEGPVALFFYPGNDTPG